MTKTEFRMYTVLSLTFIAGFLGTLSFPKGTREYPLLVFGSGVILVFFSILRGFWKNKTLADDSETRKEIIRQNETKSLTRQNITAIWITILLSAVYAVIISFVGYFPSTFFFMITLMSALKGRFQWLYVFLGVVFCVVMYVTFVYFLHISLPNGWLVTLFY